MKRTSWPSLAALLLLAASGRAAPRRTLPRR